MDQLSQVAIQGWFTIGNEGQKIDPLTRFLEKEQFFFYLCKQILWLVI
jgi:hypothetical protein